MANLARSACRRCREQKLRCSREIPSCERCVRLKAVCEFPPPPDRKLLAASRAQSRKRLSEQRNSEAPLAESSPLHTPNSIASNYSVPLNNEDPIVEEGLYLGLSNLSLPVQTLLQETYFSCMFNSLLIFHRRTFQLAFREGRLPQHVLLAVYAGASTFLHPASLIARQNVELLQPLGDLKSLGRQWAIQAGRSVLQDIDQPTFESVQTCQVLTHYWFSVGESQRNVMFSGIAYKAACTLGLDVRDLDIPFSATTLLSSPNSKWLNAEISRRCFWAVWFTQCINSDHRSGSTSIDDRIMSLPLPQAENVAMNDSQSTYPTLLDVLNQPTRSDRDSSNPSIMAELMVLIINWTKIRDLIRTRNRRSTKDWLAEMFDIEGRLSTWYARMAETFVYSRRNLYEQLVVHQQPVFIFVHVIYHQCRLVLHSSMVPHFSGLDLHERLPSEVMSLSTRIALKSAQSISELGADLLAFDWDPAKIAPFVGYCLYVSASIHVTLFCSSDFKLASIARTNLVSNLELLRSMKSYWSNLEGLWVRINVLYEAQLSRIQASELTGSRQNLGDLDQMARETRDTGLSESLADSVLDYTLRKVKPDARPDMRSAQSFEKRSYPTDLSQLIQEDSSSLQPGMTTPLMRLDSQANPGSSTNNRYPNASAVWDWTGGSALNSSMVGGYEWWQPGLDVIQQPILPYEELFSLDFGA